jgi:glycosyltransferase involved in cell wall biosynthesis
MKFSICIPNYNYERYLGRTIQSVLDQRDVDLEILVSDNASTDGSRELVRNFNDPRIKLHVNRTNVGFSRNLDRAAEMATGDWVIMLSSDDLIRAGALGTYQALLGHISRDTRRAVISSSWDIISPDDTVTGSTGPMPELWNQGDLAPELEQFAGGPVYRVPAAELLRRCLRTMKNPFNFAATCYSRELYEAVDGYGGGRIYNPDKWFHWRVLGVADTAYFVDRRLFAYRWHPNNQQALQTATSALKYWVDEYLTTLELDAALLARANVTREDFLNAYVEVDIARHGLAALARGERQRARQILAFGRATYPQLLWKNRKAWALRMLLALGPIGQKIAARAHRSYHAENGAQDRT